MAGFGERSTAAERSLEKSSRELKALRRIIEKYKDDPKGKKKMLKNRKVFDARDTDGDGLVTKEQLLRMLKADKVEAFFADYDREPHDGKASWEEIVNFLTRPHVH